MFGYLIPDASGLSKELKEEYRARYCGLCRAIGARYGSVMRTALSYELTFLALVLDGVSATEKGALPRCIKHPLRQKETTIQPHLSYAADLTVLLLAAKLEDDRRDEQSRSANAMLQKLAPKAALAEENRPEQAEKIRQSLSALAQMEAENEIRPDMPAGCFGDLVGTLMAEGGEEPKDALYRLGFALGKLLYLMDAAEDLKSDLKHERYNPLVCTDAPIRSQMLDLLSSDLIDAFDALPENKLTPLMRNILERGIWTRFRGPKAGQEDKA